MGLGLMGMGGAAGAGDALQTIFEQRMQAARLAQQDALTRLKAQEQVDAVRMHLETMRSAEADRQAARQAHEEDVRNVAARTNFTLTPAGSDITASAPGYAAAGIDPALMPVTPANPVQQTAGFQPLAPGISPVNGEGPGLQQIHGLTPILPPSGPAAPAGAAITTPQPTSPLSIPPRVTRGPTSVDQDKAAQLELKNWQAGIQQQLANVKMGAAPTPHFTPVPLYDETGKPTGAASFNTLNGTLTPLGMPGGAVTIRQPSAGKPLPYQAAENVAGLNTAEVEGVKILKALHQSGLDTSNNGLDPRWQKFVVTILKVAPDDFQKADIQQRTAYVTAALTRQLMGGRPSQYVAQMIQQHLPQGEMSGQQLAHVLSNVLEQTGERRTELGTMLPGVKGPSSGQTYQDYLQELTGEKSGEIGSLLERLNTRRGAK